jgi:hypothetical protein
VTSIVWDPEEKKPADAAALEGQIREVAPDAQVKLTLAGDAWVVRALGPAAMCTRGGGFDGRNLSAVVADVLNENGYATKA